MTRKIESKHRADKETITQLIFSALLSFSVEVMHESTMNDYRRIAKV